VTQVLDRSQPPELRDKVALLATNVTRHGFNEPVILPATGTPPHLVELSSHSGHFLGRARNYLLIFDTGDGAYVRTIGNWDPMPWYVQLSRLLGADARRTFWGLESPEHSMLRQFRGETTTMPREQLAPFQEDTTHEHT
jgi:hypothetical protein